MLVFETPLTPGVSSGCFDKLSNLCQGMVFRFKLPPRFSSLCRHSCQQAVRVKSNVDARVESAGIFCAEDGGG